MTSHIELPDSDFLRSLQSGTLPPALFNHEAHLRLAWICLEEKTADEGVEEVRRILKAYIRHLGAEAKYHETLTVAAVRAVHHFRLKSSSSDFPSFIQANPRLKSHFREILTQHYSEDHLFSASARSNYLEPDLLPFD